jgi:hypothetical protein
VHTWNVKVLLDKSCEFDKTTEMSPKKPSTEPKPTPSNKNKLRGDSIEPVAYAWDQEARRLARSLTFHGRKLKPGPLLSMLVVWYLELDEADRDEIARRGCELYEAKTSPKLKKDVGNPGASGSEPVFRGGYTKGKLGVPIAGQIDGGPKRRAGQHNAPAEIVD